MGGGRLNPYTERILGLLGDRPAAPVLEASPGRAAELFRTLGEKGLDLPWAPGKWTGRQILGHLADVELTVGFRVRQALTVEDSTVQPIDQDAWARTYPERDPAAALESFRALRAWNLTLFRLLGPAELARITHHPERGDESIDIMVRMLAGHDLNHLGQLERILQP
jgi:hypothetical protein